MPKRKVDTGGALTLLAIITLGCLIFYTIVVSSTSSYVHSCQFCTKCGNNFEYSTKKVYKESERGKYQLCPGICPDCAPKLAKQGGG